MNEKCVPEKRMSNWNELEDDLATLESWED